VILPSLLSLRHAHSRERLLPNEAELLTNVSAYVAGLKDRQVAAVKKLAAENKKSGRHPSRPTRLRAP